MEQARREPLFALFGRFLRFGLLAWGGPVAQIAMLKRELVERDRWLSPERFNRLLAVYQALPGPEAHELCVHLGIMRRGRLGGLIAGLGFMLPGLVFVLALAWLYGRIDLDQPLIAATFLGIQIGVVALIVRAVHRIGGHVLADRWLWGIAIGAAAATMLGASFWVVLSAAALIGATASIIWRWPAAIAALALVAAAILLKDNGFSVQARSAVDGSAAALFAAGLKAGLLTFGGAYTAIPFVRGDTVGRGGIDDGQFLDALALSGVVPAPLVMFATFVGYLVGGLGGALAITAGIFLPAFGFGLLLFERLEALIDDARLQQLLAGVAAGVVGLIAVTAVTIGKSVADTVPTLPAALAIFAAALALLYAWTSRFNVLAVIGLSGAAGLLLLR